MRAVTWVGVAAVALAAFASACDLLVGIEPWGAGGGDAGTGAAGATSGVAATGTGTSSTASTGTGCSSNLTSDPDNCGRCGAVCFGDVPSCDAGICAPAVYPGMSGATLLAALPNRVAVASGKAVALIAKANGGLVSVATQNAIGALAAYGNRLYAAGVDVEVVNEAGQVATFASYEEPVGTDADLKAVSMSVGSLNNSSEGLVIATSVAGRPLVHLSIANALLTNMPCTGSNTLHRVSALGDVTAAIGGNDSLLVCGPTIGTHQSASPANDVALLGVSPIRVALAGNGFIDAVDMDGTPMGTVLKHDGWDVRRVKSRGETLVFLVEAGPLHAVVEIPSAGGMPTTLFSGTSPLRELDVDSTGVYALDSVGNVIAIGR